MRVTTEELLQATCVVANADGAGWDRGRAETRPELLELDAQALDLERRLMASGESSHDARIAAIRSLAYRTDHSQAVITGNGAYMEPCVECGRPMSFPTFRESCDAVGTVCRRCERETMALDDGSHDQNRGVTFAPDGHTVIKGRTRKGKPTARVTARSDWSVTGLATLDESYLTTANVAALEACGISPAAWCEAWTQSLAPIRDRSDAARSGIDVSAVARDMVGRGTDTAIAAAVAPRAGSDIGVSWQLVRTYGPGAAIFARHTCGIAGYWPVENLPDLEAVDIDGSDDGRWFGVERATVATLAAAPMAPRAVKLSTPERDQKLRGYVRDRRGGFVRPKIGTKRASEIPEWARPLHVFGHKLTFCYGPIVGDSVFIGGSLVARGAVRVVGSDQKRETVAGKRVRTVQAARTVGTVTMAADLPSDAWQILCDGLDCGDRVEFDWPHGHGSITRAGSGRWSAVIHDSRTGEPVRVRGQRTAASVGRTLALVTSSA